MLPSMLAWRMADIAIGYLVFELTGSATMLGVMGLALALPVVSFALLGGVVADRIARRTLLALTQGGLALVGGILALLVLTGIVQVWHLFAFAVLQGALFAFNVPARQSFLTELVHKDDLVNALALRSFGMNASRVAGPALAGLLIGLPTVGIGGICLLMAVGYAVVVFSVIGLPYSPPAPTKASARQQAIAGLRYVWSTPSLRTLVVIATLILCVAASHQRLLPVFALRVFDSGPEGLGFMAAAEGIGALVGTGIIAAMSGARALGRLLLALGALLGAALAGFALAPAFLLATALLVLVGVAYAALQTLYSALLLRQADRAMSGRGDEHLADHDGANAAFGAPGGRIGRPDGCPADDGGDRRARGAAGTRLRAVQPDRAAPGLTPGAPHPPARSAPWWGAGIYRRRAASIILIIDYNIEIC